MFKLKDLKSEKLKRSTSRIILYAILDKASFENKSSVKIGQTYLSENYCISTKTVGKELKYLQDEGYLTYKRALYNNLTTTEITLTEKSIALISRPQADVPKTENKPQNKPVKTEADQPQAEVERMRQTAQKQAAEEQTEIPQTPINAHETQEISLQEKFNRLSRVNKIQCKILKDSNFNENYVKLAVEDYKIPFEVIEGIQNNKIVIV